MLLAALGAALVLSSGASGENAGEPGAGELWAPLFDGKSLDGWIPKIRGYEAGVNFGNTFRVEDGLLTVEGSRRFVHYVNGEPVIEYENAVIGGGAVAGHDPAAKPDGTPLGSGYISLQSEGHPVQFRKVEILVLPEPGA